MRRGGREGGGEGAENRAIHGPISPSGPPQSPPHCVSSVASRHLSFQHGPAFEWAWLDCTWYMAIAKRLASFPNCMTAANCSCLFQRLPARAEAPRHTVKWIRLPIYHVKIPVRRHMIPVRSSILPGWALSLVPDEGIGPWVCYDTVGVAKPHDSSSSSVTIHCKQPARSEIRTEPRSHYGLWEWQRYM